MPSNRKTNNRRSTRSEHPGKRASAKRQRSPETPASTRSPGEEMIRRPGEEMVQTSKDMMRQTSEMLSASADTMRGLQRETGKEMANALDVTKTASLAPFQIASAWSKVWQIWMRSVSGM